MAERLGAVPEQGGTRFAVWAPDVERVECLSVALEKGADGIHRGFVPGIGPGDLYNFRVGDRLLVDPYAIALDRAYGDGVPRCVVMELPTPLPKEAPRFARDGLIYEINVRGFTMLHPDVPEADRGTLRALAHPAVIGHLRKLRVSAVELMPIVAWIDERHLPPLGLRNAWGYNPVTFFPVDPRLGTLDDLRGAVAALHRAGIGVILDLVFNHTGESDVLGQTLSFRGLAEQYYYRHLPDGSLDNRTGCGNSVDCDQPMVRRMVIDALRHFVGQAGVDGFRFDLAPVLGDGLVAELLADPVLGDRVMIAEPWDLASYRLGQFPGGFLEWNDRFRDDVRRFWRGDAGVGVLATRVAGSSDVFGGEASRSVNFLAAHDGFTLKDVVSFAGKRNEANGEENRDGHSHEVCWESASPDADVRALLATLFASRGAIMLTAGDEFGRTQQGNNNAYAQDNVMTWLDWVGRDRALEDFVAGLAELRAKHGLGDPRFLRDADVRWLREDGAPMDWGDGHAVLRMQLRGIEVRFDRNARSVTFEEIGDA